MLAGFLVLGNVARAGAQFPPDTLVNLEFFDKDIAVRDLIGHMRGFSLALGVQCQHCHVGEDSLPFAAILCMI